MTEEETIEGDLATPVKPANRFDRIKAFCMRHFIVITIFKFTVLGLVIRYFVLRSELGNTTSSEALALLMGRDVTNGHFSVFRYGHYFAGTLEYLVLSPVIAIFGMTSATRIVSILFLIATSYVLWRAFVNTPYKDTMRLVMATLWVWPGLLVFTSVHVTGYMGVYQLLVASIFACAYYAAHSLRNLRYFYLWALLSGLLLWTFPLSIFAIATFAYWIFASAPALKQKTLQAFGLFLLGSLPLWIYVVSEKFVPLTRMYDESAGYITDASSNSWYAFLQFLGVRTFTNDNSTYDYLGPFFMAIFAGALLGLVVLVWIATTRIKKLKTTDFAYLHMLIIGIYTLIGCVMFAFSIDVNASFYTVLAIPFAFVVIFARDSKVTVTIALTCFLAIGSMSLYAASRDPYPSIDKSVSTATKALQNKNITRAVAPKTIAFPITVKSDNKIIVVPLDGNSFDKGRRNKVAKDLQAIVVDSNNLAQQSVALCVQAKLKTGFDRIEAGITDIYIVPKELRAKASSQLQSCIDENEKARPSGS